MEKSRWTRVPVIEPLNPVAVYEHTPAAYYSHGEYPRVLRPVGPRLGDHRTRWALKKSSPLVPDQSAEELCPPCNRSKGER